MKKRNSGEVLVDLVENSLKRKKAYDIPLDKIIEVENKIEFQKETNHNTFYCEGKRNGFLIAIETIFGYNYFKVTNDILNKRAKK